MGDTGDKRIRLDLSTWGKIKEACPLPGLRLSAPNVQQQAQVRGSGTRRRRLLIIRVC